jgi:hypothetical protein
MTISRRSFVAAALAAIAGGGSVAAAAVAVKKEPELPVVPPAKSPERGFDFGPVDWSDVPQAKWDTTSWPRETHYLGRPIGYKGHPDMVASFRFGRCESGAFDAERFARDRLAWTFEKATGGDGILYRVLPEITREDGTYPGEVVFRQYARAVGERKTVKRVMGRWGGEFAVEMTVEYDSTVGGGEIAVSCKGTNVPREHSAPGFRDTSQCAVQSQLIDEARDRWGMASLDAHHFTRTDSDVFSATFRQSICRASLPSHCFGFPPTAGIAAQFRGYNHACKVIADER